jgi:DNA-directed RNA polymerase specialized sigma24 family protein
MKRHSKIKRESIDTYIIFSNSDESKNIIAFKDVNGKARIIRVNRLLRDEYRRRKSEENSQLTDVSLNKRATNKEISLEEQVISNLEVENIIREIWKLPTPQNRRVYMFIVDEMTLTKIAKIENRSIPTVKESIDRGLENLRKKLKKFYY